jgi:hypothetical protein
MKHLKTIGDTTETPDGQLKIFTEQGIKTFDLNDKEDFEAEEARVKKYLESLGD